MLLYFSVHKKATNHIKNTIEKFELPKGKQTVFLLMKKNHQSYSIANKTSQKWKRFEFFVWVLG